MTEDRWRDKDARHRLCSWAEAAVVPTQAVLCNGPAAELSNTMHQSLLPLRHSFRPDLQNHALPLGSGDGIFGRRYQLQVVHQSAATGFCELLGPFGALNHEHPAKRMPVGLEAGEQLPERADGANHQGVVARV